MAYVARRPATLAWALTSANAVRNTAIVEVQTLIAAQAARIRLVLAWSKSYPSQGLRRLIMMSGKIKIGA